MTDETKQENPEMTAPAQAADIAAPPVAEDTSAALSDGGLTLDDSDPDVAPPQETAPPAEKPADDIPETSLSLEMDDEPAAAPVVEDAPAVETPVVEAPGGPVFDDADMQPETAAPAEEPVMTSPIQDEPAFAADPAIEAVAAEMSADAPPPPPVAEAPQDDFAETTENAFDEFPGDEAAAFGGGDDGGDDGFGGDDFGDDDGFPPEEGMMPPPGKGGAKKKILMAGGALALAAVIGGGYFVLSSADTVSTPPKRVAKVAALDPGPAPAALPDTGTEFAAAGTGAQTDLTGMAPPPQPTPLTNTDNIAGDSVDGTELASIAVAETNAVPPTDSWDMGSDNGADDFSADMPDDAALTALTADDTATADAGDAGDYDPSRETISVVSTDDGALPPPPVDTEATAAPLDFSDTGTETVADMSAETAPDAAPQTGATESTGADAATPDAVTAGTEEFAAIDPLAAAENVDPLNTENAELSEDNSFKDTPPMELSDLEPPGLISSTAIKDPEVPKMAEDETTTSSLTEPQLEAAIAPKAHDPLTPAPAPGEPPPLLSNSQQVKDMMPPTKPELTAEEQARINQARMALSKGDLEGDAIEEHKKTLREIPAKEAMIRPLPKSYLIVSRADGKAGSRPQTKPQQAGTPLANISTKPDLLRQAIAEQRAGNTQGALQSYEKILSANPSDLNALTNMLGILRKQHSTLALEKLTELHGLYPRHPGIAAQLAVTYADKKSYSQALHYFDVAASLDAPNAYYPFSKGVILDRMGRRGEATSYYQDALTMLEQGKTGHQQVPLNALRKRLGIPAY